MREIIKQKLLKNKGFEQENHVWGKLWEVDKWNRATEQVRNAAIRPRVLQQEKQWGRTTSRRTHSSQMRLLSSQVEGIWARHAELTQLSGDALCYIQWNPVGGVDPPPCMFPSEPRPSVHRLKPTGPSACNHRSSSFIAPVHPALSGHTSESVWLMSQLKKDEGKRLVSGWREPVIWGTFSIWWCWMGVQESSSHCSSNPWTAGMRRHIVKGEGINIRKVGQELWNIPVNIHRIK